MMRREPTLAEIEAHVARRDLALESLTPEQRLAIYDWLGEVNDYGDEIASWQWARAWIGNPADIREVPDWRDR